MYYPRSSIEIAKTIFEKELLLYRLFKLCFWKNKRTMKNEKNYHENVRLYLGKNWKTLHFFEVYVKSQLLKKFESFWTFFGIKSLFLLQETDWNQKYFTEFFQVRKSNKSKKKSQRCSYSWSREEFFCRKSVVTSEKKTWKIYDPHWKRIFKM